MRSLNFSNKNGNGPGNNQNNFFAEQAKIKNRRYGDDSMTAALSALYAKFIVFLGMALPVTDILSTEAPTSFYQGFYLYLYVMSVAFVIFMYTSHLRNEAVFSMLTTYGENYYYFLIKS